MDPLPAPSPIAALETPATAGPPATTPENGLLLPLRILATLAVLAACWALRDLLVPVMLAMFLALVANPLVTLLRRLRIPRWLGAMTVVVGGLALTVFLASLLLAPATVWVKKAPQELQQLAPKLKKLTRQVDQANRAAASIATATGATSAAATAAVNDAVKPASPNLWTAIWGAPRALAGILAVVLLSLFFLVHGENLQRNAISLLPDRHRKKLTVDILRTIEAEISRYVVTISLINLVLGLVLTGLLWWLGLDLADALLWGALGALLNFAPYVGPLIGVLALALVGVVEFDTPARMLAPPALYLGLQLLESEILTPLILGRRMSLSPLVMLLWLMLWGWLWGVAGVLLALPMLVCFKIVAGRVDGWQGWAKVME